MKKRKGIVWGKALKAALLSVLLFAPGIARAQYDFDVETVEAMIRDHKRIRSVLMARDGVEQANALLHQYSKKAADEHYEINLELDKFTRLFDVIDVIVTGTATVYNASNAYSDVKERLGQYETLLEKYKEKLLEKGNIQRGDTLILTTAEKAIESIYADGKNIYTSLTALIAYGSGKVPCNTSDLLRVIHDIDVSLDDISKSVNKAYLTTSRYIDTRLGFYKREVYSRRGRKVIGSEAMSRWKASTKSAAGQ